MRISAATVAKRAAGNDPHGAKVLAIVEALPRDVIAAVIHEYRTGMAPPPVQLPTKRRKARAPKQQAAKSESPPRVDTEARFRDFDAAYDDWVANLGANMSPRIP